MIWLFFAFLASMSFAVTNILDNFFINKIFKSHPISSIFYGNLVMTSVLFLFFLILRPGMPPLELMPFFIFVAVMDILYLVPYFKALEIEDTSIVSALFNFGRMFTPIIAFFAIGELLGLNQYIGFVVIILSSALLTLNNHANKIRLNSAFFYMLLSSFLGSVQIVTFKHIFTNIDWVSGYLWSFVFVGIANLSLLLINNTRKTIMSDTTNFRRNYKFVLAESIISIIAWGGSTAAFALADASVVQGITASKPFFVLIYTLIFTKTFPYLFKEQIDRKNVIKKVILFVFLIIGVILIVQ